MDFFAVLGDDEAERKAAWSVIEGIIPELARADWKPTTFDYREFGLAFLRDRRNRHHDVAGPQLLIDAIGDRKPDGAKTNISVGPCIYVFVSVERGVVIKVGESDDGRARIVNQHLRSGSDRSTLRGHYSWGDLPAEIENDAIVLLHFSLPTHDRHERIAIEAALTALLKPEMP